MIGLSPKEECESSQLVIVDIKKLKTQSELGIVEKVFNPSTREVDL